ncbi:MAG: hypothetical protein IKB55_05485 [Clostridia bacterium]|nr:hypothetical protein [Clostridia bacterium]
MPIRINNIKIPVNSDMRVEEAVIKKTGISSAGDVRIIKKSVDARKKSELKFVYSVIIDPDCNQEKLAAKIGADAVLIKKQERTPFIFGNKKLTSRPVIAGFGPAGIFAAYTLARNGYKPIVIERGGDVESRDIAVKKFWNGGGLDPENNVQFGEGGAGTFSDGKLTTRINDARCEAVLETFAAFGAPEEITYQAKPHIGTDKLKTVVAEMRKEIISLGGEIRFFSKLEDIRITERLEAVKINGQWQDCSVLVLAIGHSARDTFEMLFKKGIKMEPKPFSVGFRVEHKQEMIDRAMYGDFAGHPKLSHADYALSYRENGRGVYSFCMCPGGSVVAAASEEGGVVTNGMSEYARDKENANSAIVVSVTPDDFGDGALDGVKFQREIEKRAFNMAGKNYKAPCQYLNEFLGMGKGGNTTPSYLPGVEFTDISRIYPGFINNMLKTGFAEFDKKIKGFAKGGVHTGPETRTSSPVCIRRNDELVSASANGIYPCGEGAGYAGGIMSAAVDGIKIAEKIMSVYAPCK